LSRAVSDLIDNPDNQVIRPEQIECEVGGSSEELEMRTRKTHNLSNNLVKDLNAQNQHINKLSKVSTLSQAESYFPEAMAPRLT